MAITTLDGLLAGMLPAVDVYKASTTGEAAGQFHSTWYLAGLPGAATAPAMGVNGTALAGPSVAGQIPFPAAVGGENIYLARMEAMQSAAIGSITLCDRIWMNSGLVLATLTAQSITTPTLDRDGIFDGSYTGFGVQAGIEVHTAALNNAGVITNCTLQYTNSDGTAGRTGTISIPATAALGTFIPFLLAAGDKGIRSIQSVTFGTSFGTTGGVSLVLYRQVVSMGTVNVNTGYERDAIQLGFPRMHDASVPFLLYLLTGTGVGITDLGFTWAQG